MTTTCYACDPDNPEHIFAPDGDGWTATFAEHFNGPPRSVNGGVAIGALACPAITLALRGGVRHAVAARMAGRIRRPVPVETALRLTAAAAHDGRVETSVHNGSELLISGAVEIAALDAQPSPGDVVQAPPVHLAADLRSMATLASGEPGPLTVPDERHPFPTCFSCGPANPRGLRIRPRTAGGREVASPWQPLPAYADADGVLAPAIIGGALDCSNAMALAVAHPEMDGMRTLVPILAAYDMHILRLPPAAPWGGYTVVARATGVEGRKYRSVSALFDAAGAPYAVADTTWVALGKENLGPGS